MSPEAIDYIGAAERALDRARKTAAAGIFESAARDAYTAALSAARAIIFDKTGVAPKTHSGTRSQLFEVIQGGLAFDATLARFLREGFEIKQTIDYDVSPANVDHALAMEFIARATAFVAAARAVLEGKT